MSYSNCTRCRGLVLDEDHACRICQRPVRPGAGAAATHASSRPATAPTPSTTHVVEPVAPSTRGSVRAPRPANPSAGSLAPTGSAAPPPAAPPPAPLFPDAAFTTPRFAPTTRRVVAPTPGTAAAISVRGLTKIYGEADLAVTAVRDVSFEVRDGEIVLIMGPSGSGKTTLLLMLGAMLRPTAGSVTIGGTEVSSTPERRLPALRASHLGFVFQDFNLLSALDATENVEIACNLAGVRGRQARARAQAVLGRVGLGHRLGFRPHQLSGGEKQRVAVARALANDPPLLLADEPTANLDSAHGREIGDLLRRLADEDGRTSLIVTHDERLMNIADRVLWLEDGALQPKEHR